MSHYITADLPSGAEVVLSGGTSSSTLFAMRATGFDLYAAYEAWDGNGGSSGSGKRTEVSHEVARSAFRKALSWALAVQEAITSEMAATDLSTTGEGVAAWKLLGMSLEERLAELGDPIPPDVSGEDRAAAEAGMAAILAKLKDGPPDAEDCERALRSVAMVMDFSWEVYQGTRTGPATMSFC